MNQMGHWPSGTTLWFQPKCASNMAGTAHIAAPSANQLTITSALSHPWNPQRYAEKSAPQKTDRKPRPKTVPPRDRHHQGFHLHQSFQRLFLKTCHFWEDGLGNLMESHFMVNLGCKFVSESSAKWSKVLRPEGSIQPGLQTIWSWSLIAVGSAATPTSW